MNAPALRVQKREIVELPIAQIKLDGVANIREFYSPESLNDLSQSIYEVGVIGPVIVSGEKNGTCELVIGSRRIKASLRAGKETIPAIVMEGLDPKTKLVMALSENIHHEDLTPFGEARTMLRLLNEHGMSMKELSLTIGYTESTISNRIKLLKLPESVQELVSKNLVKLSTVSVLEHLKSPEDQARFAKITVDHALNAQELGALVVAEKKKEVEKKEAAATRARQAMTSKKVGLRLSVITNAVRQLMLVAIKMSKPDLAVVKSALLKLESEVHDWIQKIDAELKAKQKSKK